MGTCQTPIIENMQKITLSVSPLNLEQETEMPENGFKRVFIYGIGSSGLTAFEYALAHHAENGYMAMRIKKIDIYQTFEHLSHLVQQLPGFADRDDVHLAFRIEKIEPASSSEIVKAMADSAGCGDSCCDHDSFPIVTD